MKVLMIGPSPRKSKGGMATVIKEIQEDELMNEKYDIDYYSSFIDGNTIIRYSFSIIAFICFYFLKRGYDIYHIHVASRGSTFRKGLYVKAAKRWGKKVVLHVHGAQYMEFFNEISERKKTEVISILNSADKVIALSDSWKSKFETTFKIRNCVTIENGINVNTYRKAISYEREYDKAFLALGRLGKRKGTYDIIEAVESIVDKCKDIKVYLAGDGEIDKVRKLVKDKGLERNIIVTGWVDLDMKLYWLSKSSTLILPSYNEGLPMSILEGMAAGKAIIATNVGAIPEVINENNGIIISPGNIKALGAAISELYDNHEMIFKYGAQNLKVAENQFSTKMMHNKIIAVWDSL